MKTRGRQRLDWCPGCNSSFPYQQRTWTGTQQVLVAQQFSLALSSGLSR